MCICDIYVIGNVHKYACIMCVDTKIVQTDRDGIPMNISKCIPKTVRITENKSRLKKLKNIS